MIRVYVAGAISSSNPIQFLDNIRKGARLSAQALLAGYAVFSPFIDFQLFLALNGEEKIDIETIQNQSLAWLKVSDAVLVVPGWENSKGTEKELAIARGLGIPIYFTLEGLKSSVHGKI